MIVLYVIVLRLWKRLAAKACTRNELRKAWQSEATCAGSSRVTHAKDVLNTTRNICRNSSTMRSTTQRASTLVARFVSSTSVAHTCSSHHDVLMRVWVPSVCWSIAPPSARQRRQRAASAAPASHRPVFVVSCL